MHFRLGVAAVVAVAAMLTLSSAVPIGHPSVADSERSLPNSATGKGRQSSGAAMPASIAGQTDPPVGALPLARALKELRDSAKAPTIETDGLGHVVSLVAPPGARIETPAKNVDAFVRRYAAAFGLTSGYLAERTKATAVPGGDRVIRYQQVADGLPVIGGQIVVTTDAGGRVRGVAAEATQASPASTRAAVSESAAGAAAVTAAAKRFGFDSARLRAQQASLWLYDPQLIGAPGTPGTRPVWWIEVAGAHGAVATVLVDAATGSAVLVGNAKREAVDRIVCDLANAKVNLDYSSTYACSRTSTLGRQAVTRVEGGPASSEAEVNTAYDLLGLVHGFYRTHYRVDSFDGRGATLPATVRACYIYETECPWENAFWDGTQFVFGSQFLTDDIVGHEYTHAIIDSSSELFYWYQSGAINESLSDIFGEFIDQSHVADPEDTSKQWLVGEDTQGGEFRDMANPNRFGDPGAYRDEYWYPGEEDNGGVHWNSGVGNRLAYLIATGGSNPANGIGVAKSKALWYRVLHMLPSGADYATLGQTLTRACVELIGHYGFTRPDCFTSIANARAATGTGHPEDSGACPNSLVAGESVFSDDFEIRDRWSVDAKWHYIPSSAFPYAWAASGKGALYGESPANGGNGFATLKNPITLPVGGDFDSPYLSYKALPPWNAAILSSPEPRWQYDDVNDTEGWRSLTFITNIGGGGYTRLVHGLGHLAGKTIRLRMIVESGRAYFVDDVRISTCHQTHLSAYEVSALWSGTSAEVTWGYATSGWANHFELSYDPPIPGAPTNLPSVGTSATVELTGLDPSTTYAITINRIFDDGPLVYVPVTFRFAADPKLVCLTNAPLRAYWSPTRGKPVADPCRTAVEVPQKPGDD